MADFCSLCYYGDIDYDKLIANNLDVIKDHLKKNGWCTVSDGVCEGCGEHFIKIKEDLTVEVGTKGYIGKLNPVTYKIEIDESSKVFQEVYKEKKERHEQTVKVLEREFQAVKHIAYAIYMVGAEKGIISNHSCVMFDEFNPKEHKEINEMAWDAYRHINEVKHGY